MEVASIRSWWVSWYSHRQLDEFELHAPWWVTGYDADGNDICVAAVLAESEADAYAQIRNAYDAPRSDGDIRERFCDELTATPFNDRFPQAEWMAWDPETLTTCRCGAHS